MTDAQRVVVAALNRWLPPLAVDHLLRKTLHEVGVSADRLSANEWAQILRGPLTHNLKQVLPIPGLDHELAAVADQLSTRQPIAAMAPFEPGTTFQGTSVREEVDLSSSAQRQEFIQELAHLDHVQGVALLGPGFQELRFPGASASLAHSLDSFLHRLASQGNYGIVYLEMANGTMVARRLEQGTITIFIRPGANIGQFFFVLNRIGNTRRSSA